MLEKPPLLIVIVGINGAGKSTFYHNKIRPRFDGLFINADIWERENFPDEVGKHSAEAARWASDQRALLISEGESFATESVFFSERNDVVRKAKTAGYRVELIHIHVKSPLLARRRVEQRVTDGGHNVSEQLINQRFSRVEEYLTKTASLVDRLEVFENSEDARGHRHLLTIENGTITDLGPNLPPSIERQYQRELTAYRAP